MTRRFPELAVIFEQIGANQTVLDGELIIPSDGKSDFYKLQKRWLLSTPRRIERASNETPAAFVAFDVLRAKGIWLLQMPLMEREEHLVELVRDSNERIRSTHIEEDGTTNSPKR